MKKILFLLVMLFCSLNVIGGERITSGYCEGRGKILKKIYEPPSYDPPVSSSLTIVTTYKSCFINDTKYNNIKVYRTYYDYDKNAKIPAREDFTSDDNYCAEQEHKKRNSGLIIYGTNSEGECELLH